jgi:FG-GAP-like repeat/Lectin C-type domain
VTTSNAPALQLNQTSTNLLINTSSVIAPGLQILNLTNNTSSSNLPGARVSIVNPTGTESLSVIGTAAGVTNGSISTTGISWSYDSSTGVMTLTGSTSFANYESALRQVTYNSGSNPTNTNRNIRFTLGDLATNAAGDRAYKFVAAPATTPGSNLWTDANSAANADSYLGNTGYLTTITNEAENDIVKSLLPGVNAWIGAGDFTTEGQWRWVTGPEGQANSGAGTVFFQNGTIDTNTSSDPSSWTSPTATPGYSNWFNFEPNNYGNVEDNAFIVGRSTFSAADIGKWNDGATNNIGGDYGADGYIVEFGGFSGQNFQLAGNITINLTNQSPAVVGGKNITLRNNASSQNAIWQLNGATLTDSKFITSVPDKNWTMVSSADFNGDGKDDLLWRNYSTGQNAIWLKDGANLDSFSAAGQKFLTLVTDTDWKMISAADFNGDNKADILWRNSRNGENAIWFMDATTVTQDGRYASDEQFFTSSRRFTDTSWEMVGAGNFDSDNKADIVWRNKVTGDNAIWLMDGTSGTPVASKAGGEKFITQVADSNWKIVGIGDFNGDNKSDLAWRNSSTGENAVWTVNTNVLTNSGNFFSTTEQFIKNENGANVIVQGNNWRIEAVGDTNNDGKSDLIWRNYATDENAVWQMNGNIAAAAGQQIVKFSNNNDVLTGDINWDIIDSYIA